MQTLTDNRLDFHRKLEFVWDEVFLTGKTYFQPPSNIKLEYPCMVYEPSGIENRNADNKPYRRNFRYSVKVISKSPLHPVIDRLLDFKYATYDRHYVADGLNHDVFTIYN